MLVLLGIAASVLFTLGLLAYFTNPDNDGLGDAMDAVSRWAYPDIPEYKE